MKNDCYKFDKEKIEAALLKENDDLKEENDMLKNRVTMLKEMLSCYCTYIHKLENIIEGEDNDE